MYFAFCFSCSWARYSLPLLRRRVRPWVPGGNGPALEGAAALLVLEDVRAEAARQAHLGAGVASHGQPLLRFGGRQPLCGTGVTSLIDVTSMPAFWIERTAVSRPEPGPFTCTSARRRPCSWAALAARSAASWAANGVDLREPL